MLSFIREQSFGDLPAEKKAAAGQTPAEGRQSASEKEFLTVATHSQRVRRSTALLTVLLVAGLLCIWFMVKKTSPQAARAADANETDIASAITRITGVRSELFDRMDEIVSKFYEFSQVLQVGVNELVKNPFELELFLAGLKAKAEAAEQVLQIDPDVLMRQLMEKQAGDLMLQGIMQSDRGNCCMIDGKTIYVNDSIADFTVVEIGANSVKLQWNPKDDSARFPAGSDKAQIVLKLLEE